MVDFKKLSDKMRQDRGLPPEEDHVSQEIKDLVARGHVTSEEYGHLRMNSWEQDALIPAMEDKLLIERLRYSLLNAERPRHPALTYDDALKLFAVEMAKRLERQSQALTRLRLCACQLGDFMYEPVRLASQDMIQAIDEALAG